jgi:hypothetical protein
MKIIHPFMAAAGVAVDPKTTRESSPHPAFWANLFKLKKRLILKGLSTQSTQWLNR